MSSSSSAAASVLGFAAVAPYRVLFPVGAAFAIAGALPWIVYAWAGGGYPAMLYRAWMIEGFELCFVLGFLLTAMPAFTRGERRRTWELGVATLAALGVAAGGVAGVPLVIHGSFA